MDIDSRGQLIAAARLITILANAELDSIDRRLKQSADSELLTALTYLRADWLNAYSAAVEVLRLAHSVEV